MEQKPYPESFLTSAHSGSHPAALVKKVPLEIIFDIPMIFGVGGRTPGIIILTIQPWRDPSSHLSFPTGNLRAYNMTAPSLAAPSLTPSQMVTPNLQQFFPQATRQSLLGPPPVGVPMNPSQVNHSGRNSQKQARNPSSITPNRKVSSALSGATVRMGQGRPWCQPSSMRLPWPLGRSCSLSVPQRLASPALEMPLCS